MFQPKQMVHLLIAATKDQLASVVTELYSHRVFHITDFVDQGKDEYSGARIGTPLDGSSDIATQLIKIRSIENVFQSNPALIDTPQKSESEIRKEIKSLLPKIESEVNDLTVQRSNYESKIRECKQKISELEPFTYIPLEMELYHGYESITPLVGYIDKNIDIDYPHEKFYSETKSGNLIALFVQNKDVIGVERCLSDVNFQAINIPTEIGMAKDLIDKYNSDLAIAQTIYNETTLEISDLKTKYVGVLSACDEVLSCDVERAEAPLRFATTDHAFVVDGWVPKSTVNSVVKGLNKATKGSVYIDVDDSIPEDINSVPVEYNNPSFAKPTQLLMDVYARPKYNEIDPTLLLAIMFPLFFGLIVGDVGYGIIFLILALLVRKMAMFRGPGGKDLIKILVGSSISTIIFGLLYSECLGYSLPWHSLIFQRHLPIGVEDVAAAHGPDAMPLLIISVWFGIVYITLGRIFGMINHYRMMRPGIHRIKSVLSQFGWILILWGILILGWSVFSVKEKLNISGMMPDLTNSSSILFGLSFPVIISIIMLVTGCAFLFWENKLDLMEIPTVLSHMLSFCRLAAVGLSSVAIAMVVNYLSFGMFIHPALDSNFSISGVIMFVVGVLIFIFGHALNVGLGILGGGLHSIRLHYVELFTKFYVGGGIKYNPFGSKNKFIKE
ncbi:MAG TPA: V-type ATP synthase subunit I [Methanocorpusculum sp.]|nr:V-type ATP synthase subunit I [Methanocorpusculum sp.]